MDEILECCIMFSDRVMCSYWPRLRLPERLEVHHLQQRQKRCCQRCESQMAGLMESCWPWFKIWVPNINKPVRLVGNKKWLWHRTVQVSNFQSQVFHFLLTSEGRNFEPSSHPSFRLLRRRVGKGLQVHGAESLDWASSLQKNHDSCPADPCQVYPAYSKSERRTSLATN